MSGTEGYSAPAPVARYVVAQEPDGRILRSGTCARQDLPHQARLAGERVFEVELNATVDPLSQSMDLAAGVLIDWQPPKPADTELQTWDWDAATRRWTPIPTLLALERQAHGAIDAAAGQARSRYITDVPGQQGVYLRKAEQARTYAAAGYTGEVPPYIQAEADAMQITPAAATDRILAVAVLWDDTLSPAIERERIGGKARATSAKEAGDRAGLLQAQDAAIAALGGI